MKHVMATLAGRCMGMIAALGSVFNNMHPGDFTFDGEYPIGTAIGENITRDKNIWQTGDVGIPIEIKP